MSLRRSGMRLGVIINSGLASLARRTIVRRYRNSVKPYVFNLTTEKLIAIWG
jgi:hypothetical protein